MRNYIDEVVTPVRFMGEEYENFGLCPVTYNVYKYVEYADGSAWWVPRKICMHNSSGYPSVCLTNGKSVGLHRIIKETLNEYDPPEGVSEEEWDKTPEAVKTAYIKHGLMVHHINHDKLDYCIENLQFSNRCHNARAAGEYYNGN